MKSKKIAVVGLGYVGLPLAVAFGKNYETVGFDIDKGRVLELSQGVDRTLEVEASELCDSRKLTFTSDPKELSDCTIFIITVPTPIDSAKRPDLRPLQSATETVGRVMAKSSVVIYESTVYPGCTEEVCIPILEKISGLRYNIDFSCGYSPERVNPGDKINTLSKITKIVSGSNESVSQVIAELYASIIDAGVFCASSMKVAEAAKVIENTQRDLNIALVNELSMICHRLNIDTLDVLEAAGSKWNFLPFRPGLVGGHCIGVDPYYLTHKAEQVGYDPQVILAGRRINDGMAKYSALGFIKHMVKNNIDPSKSRVAVMGVTFKENCPDVRNSKIFDLIEELSDWGVHVRAFDPWASAAEVFESHGVAIESMPTDELFDGLIVAVGHDEFRAMSPAELRQLCEQEKPVIADLKAVYNRQALMDAGLIVFRL